MADNEIDKSSSSSKLKPVADAELIMSNPLAFMKQQEALKVKEQGSIQILTSNQLFTDPIDIALKS